MSQKQLEQPRNNRYPCGTENAEVLPDEPGQGSCCATQPNRKHEANAIKEPDGGEGLLSGAPREGEADQVDRASRELEYPQVNEAGVDGKQPGDQPKTQPVPRRHPMPHPSQTQQQSQ